MPRTTLDKTSKDRLRQFGFQGIEGRVGHRNALVFSRYHGLFGEPMATLAVIGKDYGLSRERIRQIVARTRTVMGLP